MEYTIYATAVNSIQGVEANRVINLVDFNLFDVLHDARSNKHDKQITKVLIRPGPGGTIFCQTEWTQTVCKGCQQTTKLKGILS